jgi:hypothetical protein
MRIGSESTAGVAETTGLLLAGALQQLTCLWFLQLHSLHSTLLVNFRQQLQLARCLICLASCFLLPLTHV